MKYLKTYENLNQEPVIKYHENGQKLSELYYLNGEYHREDGPAYTGWYKNGQKSNEIYYLNNIYYTIENWLDKLKEIDSPHYQDQLVKYEAEKYNL